jgi:hypothetical protein
MKKKYILIIGAIMLSVLFVMFLDKQNHPFEVIKSGKVKKAYSVYSRISSSGVSGTKQKLILKMSTLVTLTMAGFAGVKTRINANSKRWESTLQAT